MQYSNLSDILGCLLGIIFSSVFLYYFAKRLGERKKLKKYGVRVVGIILDYKMDDKDGVYFSPIIKFKTIHGKEYIVTSEEGGVERKHLGKEIALYYDKENPHKIMIPEEDASKLAILLFMAFSLCCLGVFIFELLKLWN